MMWVVWLPCGVVIVVSAEQDTSYLAAKYKLLPPLFFFFPWLATFSALFFRHGFLDCPHHPHLPRSPAGTSPGALLSFPQSFLLRASDRYFQAYSPLSPSYPCILPQASLPPLPSGYPTLKQGSREAEIRGAVEGFQGEKCSCRC